MIHHKGIFFATCEKRIINQPLIFLYLKIIGVYNISHFFTLRRTFLFVPQFFSDYMECCTFWVLKFVNKIKKTANLSFCCSYSKLKNSDFFDVYLFMRKGVCYRLYPRKEHLRSFSLRAVQSE